MKDYLEILCKTINEGVITSSRNGQIRSMPACMFAFNMQHGPFPLITTKKITFNKVLSELLWFLTGSNNEWDLRLIEQQKIVPSTLRHMILQADSEVGIRLTDNYYASPYQTKPVTQELKKLREEGHLLPPSIWEPWSDKKTGHLGHIYGPNWRNFRSSAEAYQKHRGIDQINALEHALNLEQFDSRRLLVSAWNPHFIPKDNVSVQLNLDSMDVSLPACHFAFQLHIANRVCSLIWSQRSVDVCIGLPFNIASYATLLRMICQSYQLQPGWLVGHLSNVHVYEEHVEDAKKQLVREPYPLPLMLIKERKERLVDYTMNDFVLQNYSHHSFIHYQVKL